MEENLRKITLRWQFRLRDRFLGRVALRSGLPTLEAPLTKTPEQSFYELLLSRFFNDPELQSVDQVLDIGSRNGSYLPALARSCPRARITGVELDGGRRYWNGFRRADYGNAIAQALRSAEREASYLWGDLRDFSAKDLSLTSKGVLLISIFYPFVSDAPCSDWGLPPEFADFQSILKRLLVLARQIPETKTWLLSAHQGEWEAERARSAFNSLCLNAAETRVAREEFAPLWPSEHDASLFRVSLSI